MRQRAGTRERVLGACIAGLLAGGVTAAALQREEMRTPPADPRQPVIAQPLTPPGSLPSGAPEPDVPLKEQVLPEIKYPLEQLGYEVVFEAARSDVVGETDPRRKLITIYVQPEWDLRTIVLVTAHEVGHAAALEYMDEKRQQEWLAQRGITGAPWYPCDTCSERNAGVGDYADVFTLAVAGKGNFTSTLAEPPTEEELEALTRFFYPEDAVAPKDYTG